MGEQDGRVYLSAFVDPDLKDFLRGQALKNDRSVSAEVRHALRLYRMNAPALRLARPPVPIKHGR